MPGLPGAKESCELTDNTRITAHGCTELCVAENTRLGKLATSRRLVQPRALVFLMLLSQPSSLAL